MFDELVEALVSFPASGFLRYCTGKCTNLATRGCPAGDRALRLPAGFGCMQTQIARITRLHGWRAV